MKRELNQNQRQSKKDNEENWLDDVLQRQEHDLEEEEEILSSVPNRIRHKWIDEKEEK